MKRIRKAMALLFALVICLGMLPGSAFAAGRDTARIEKTDSQIEKTAAAISSRDGMLTFSSDAPFTLETANHAKNWNGTLQYSTNAQTWTTWNGAATLSSAAHSGKQRLYLRGIGNSVITGIGECSRWVLTGSNVACSGNIENLLNYQTVAAGNHPSMGYNCFGCLFYNCESLTTAPMLPATTLNDYCYEWMFAGCRSLATAPALPATVLADSCYSWMFLGCESLKDAPVLPATILADDCYYCMFMGCISLTTAPTLPATTLASHCYDGMFLCCNALTALPALPATYLPSGCYKDMFLTCAGIKLSEVQTEEYNTPYRIPSLGALEYAAEDALENMFWYTGGPFDGTPEAGKVYYVQGPAVQPDDMALRFSADSSFTLETANHSKNWDGTLEYSADAEHWTVWDGAETLGSGLHNGRHDLYLRGVSNTRISTAESQRWVLTGTGSGPAPQQEEPPQRWQVNGPNISCSGNIENLLDYVTVVFGAHPQMDSGCFAYLFADNTSLISAPALPATTLTNRCYEGMFRNCSALTKAPALPATTLKQSCYKRMFEGCTALRAAPALRATIARVSCYERMFAGCTSLTALPALPAWWVEDYCYNGMFQGCIRIRLSETPTNGHTIAYGLPADSTWYDHIGNEVFTDMFSGTGGSFTGTPDANTTYYLHNSNSIVW